MAIKGNKRTKLLATATKTATATYGPYVNKGRTLRITIKSSNPQATPSVTPKIQAVDPTGGATDVLTGVAITGAGVQILEVGPDIAASANAKAQAVAPSRFNIVLTHGDADAIDIEMWMEELS
jgi:hypothetical protein